MTKSPFPVLALLLAAGCARHTIPPVVLINPTRLGPAEDFRAGIVAATNTKLEFVLDSAAQVIVLRVTDLGVEPVRPAGGASPTTVAAGLHRVSARTFLLPSSSWVDAPESRAAPASSSTCVYDYKEPTPSSTLVTDSAGRLVRKTVPARQAYEDCQRRERTRRSVFDRSGSTGGYTAVPRDGYWLLIVSDAETSADDLRGRLELPDTTLEATVRRLPEVLVGNRTTRWAAYYIAFGAPSTY